MISFGRFVLKNTLLIFCYKNCVKILRFRIWKNSTKISLFLNKSNLFIRIVRLRSAPHFAIWRQTWNCILIIFSTFSSRFIDKNRLEKRLLSLIDKIHMLQNFKLFSRKKTQIEKLSFTVSMSMARSKTLTNCLIKKLFLLFFIFDCILNHFFVSYILEHYFVLNFV